MGNYCFRCCNSQKEGSQEKNKNINPNIIILENNVLDEIYSIDYYTKNKIQYEYKNTKIFLPPLENKRVYVCKIYDGDTFTISTKFPWDITNTYRFSVRIKGIDCPELRTKNLIEKDIALRAKQYAIELLSKSNNFVFLHNIIYDKYGRLCADVTLDMTTINNNFALLMLEKRLAVKYDGGTKKIPKNWELYFTKGII